jgi:hypothetical protein
MIYIERCRWFCDIYLDSWAWFIVLGVPTASAKTKEQSKATHQWRSRDLEAAILTPAKDNQQLEDSIIDSKAFLFRKDSIEPREVSNKFYNYGRVTPIEISTLRAFNPIE